MAKVCEQCGKHTMVGHLVSHSNIKTLRRFKPNLVIKRLFDKQTGRMMKRKVCTRCLRTLVKVAV